MTASGLFDLREGDHEAQPLPNLRIRSGDGLSVVTIAGRVLSWNGAAEEQLHVPADRAIGSTLAELGRTQESREAIWGHHLTSVGAHLSGNPPVRRVLATVDNRGNGVVVHISSVLVEIVHRSPLLAYSFTVEHTGEGATSQPPPPLGLTTREWEVACLLMSGLGTSETARELGISYATVRAHIRKILSTLDANTRTQAMMRLWSRYGIPEQSPFRGPSA